jgi:hypothetical protein
MSIVVFNPVEFRDLYPQFMDFSDAQILFAFDVACLVVDNSERSRVPYAPPEEMARRTILYLLVCHLCELKARGGVVGNVTSATQGSVNVSFTAPANPDGQWFFQTQCGATAWQLLAGYAAGGRLYHGCHH